MKKLLILMLIAFSTANANELDLTMSCEYIDNNTENDIKRCENDEVVCYYLTSFLKGGASCKFKI